MKAGIGGHAVAAAIDQRTREQNQQAQRAFHNSRLKWLLNRLMLVVHKPQQ